MSDVQAEFNQLQKTLLKHKYLYYVKTEPVISDYEYDMLEMKSKELAKNLGFTVDVWEGPTPEEANHVHWMVDFDETHPLAKEVMEEVDNAKSES